MDFSEEISALKSKAETQLHALSTKEKTKNALFLPFIQALGYDPFDVREVEPGFAVTVEGGEQWKIDYAIKKGGTPIMLFECKEAGTDLSGYDPDPLFRYFSEIDARIGVLTNGIDYRFFADLSEEIGGDKRPFLTFNLLDHGAEDVGHLEQMRKTFFDVSEVLSNARDVKYKSLFKEYLDLQRKAPDEQFVRFMTERVNGGQVPDGFHERFGPVVREALREFTEDKSTSQPESRRREETRQPTRQSDEPTLTGENDTASLKQKEDPTPPKQKKEKPTGENVNGEENGHGPFEKNLAERVIDDF